MHGFAVTTDDRKPADFYWVEGGVNVEGPWMNQMLKQHGKPVDTMESAAPPKENTVNDQQKV